MTPTGRRSDMLHYQEVLRRGRAPFGITTTSSRGGGNMSRNPFGVQDAPDPDGEDVTAFASGVRLTGSADDDNAEAWDGPSAATPAALEGNWSSRWNANGLGWQQGHGRISVDGNRVYILFNWDDATKQGLIEARWDGQDRLIGRYLNLERRKSLGHGSA
jgi:hypothetical protein